MNNPDFDIILGDFIEVYVPSYKGLQNWRTVREPHDYAHIDFYTTRGGDIIIDGKKYMEEANTLLCIPKNKRYTGIVRNELHQYYSFLFSYETDDGSADFPFPVIFTPKDPQYFLSKYKEAYNLSIIQPFGYKTRIRKIIYDVLAKIIEEHHTAINNDNGGYTIRKSVDFIHRNFDKNDFSLEDIAKISGITDSHFRRVFKKVYGVAPSKYINTLRLNKSKAMLSDTDISIEEISYQCGYNNYSYFVRAFKTSFGLTPSEYRKANKNDNLI